MAVTLDRATMHRGQVVRITGTVDPSQLVQCVVERRSGSRWLTERSRGLNVVDRTFGLRVRLRRAGTYRVTVISGTTRRRRILRVR
jgi:hypothetical protein